MTTMKMAILKATGEPIKGKRGQYAEGKTFGGSLHHTGRSRDEYEFVDVDISQMNGIQDYKVVPKTEPKEFKVTEIHGTDWNDDGRYELVTPEGGFTIGSLCECPEDATLGRDLNFAYDVVDLMKEAYDAGVRGDIFIVETKDEDEEGEE